MSSVAWNASGPAGAAAASSGGGGGIDPISSAVGAATQIASTISSIVLASQQQRFMQNLDLLDQRQQIELAEKLQKANSNAEKLQILSSSMTQYLIENDKQAKRSSVILYVLAGSLAIILLGIVVYVSKTKK